VPAADKRSAVVDLAKGIAITLVVIAHYLPDDSPGWWNSLNDLISRIDVRVFFFVAGYIWHLRPGERYFGYLGRKARRLLIPYFAVAAFFLSIKLVPSLLMDLANPVSRGSIVNILIDPLHSYVPLLWFLYSLFCIQAVFPAIHRLGPRTFPVLIAVTTVLGVPSSLFCIGPTLGSLPYFLVGAYVAQALHINLDKHISRQAPPLAVLCAVLFLTIWWLWTPGTTVGVRVSDALLGMIGVAVTILVCQSIAARGYGWLRLLAYVGTFSMTIYLFHTLFESSMRVALNHLPVLSNLPFLMKAIPSIAAGVCLPVVARSFVIRMRASRWWLRTGAHTSGRSVESAGQGR
jgi:fucose 4-O-acetylase-like acetyltransferase